MDGHNKYLRSTCRDRSTALYGLDGLIDGMGHGTKETRMLWLFTELD